MKPCISVQGHLDEFNTILIDLENLDVDVDDEDKAVLLVLSLPASYKHFKEIMLYDKRKALSFDDVKSAFLSKQKYDDDMEPESENLDVDVDDEDKAVLLVLSLPASYKHFKEIMLYDKRKALSFDDVKSAFLSKQKYDDDMEPESGKGLVARG
nr:retrovirus-related Pol polyprotein from transposon TNT 1-94 [Tanacetum cinerariifolium]